MIKKGGYLLYQNKRVKFAPEIKTTGEPSERVFFFRIINR